MKMHGCMANGALLSETLVAPLPDSSGSASNGTALRDRLAEAGFVFLRGVIPEDVVLAARREVLQRLASVGEVAEPVEAGLWSGTSQRRERQPDLGRFWQSVSEAPQVRRVSHGPELLGLVERIYGEPAVGQDFLYLRAGVPGRSTDLHYDYPFFAQTTQRTLTLWVPLGEVPVELGPLVIVEGSNHFDDLIAEARSIDKLRDPMGKRAALTDGIEAFARSRNARVLTANFRPGDVVVLSMLICHGSLQNHSADNRMRLSFDVRYQPLADPRDERFFGAPPRGLTGNSYGELNGAKPLSEDWHQR
jgi:hypothetical protein